MGPDKFKDKYDFLDRREDGSIYISRKITTQDIDDQIGFTAKVLLSQMMDEQEDSKDSKSSIKNKMNQMFGHNK